jgi:hypothetical protein
VGALATRLGRKEAGLELAREAAATASKWQMTDQNRFVLSSISQAVAVCDVALGLSLLEKFPQQGERPRFIADLAASLDDVEKAESLLNDVDGWYATDARLKLAYRIAAKQPADAMRLIKAIPQQYEVQKAKGLGWIATAIAQTDRALAHSLIDRAFTILLASTDRSYGGRGGRPAEAAVLAVLAEKIGYPDMESAVHRALAVRSTSRAEDFNSPAANQESNMMLALYLAVIDRETAKLVLQAIEPHSDCVGYGYSGVWRGEWFKAWALVDPQHALELIEKELARTDDQRTRQNAESSAQELVELWLTAPSGRLKNIAQRYSDSFPPDWDR